MRKDVLIIGAGGHAQVIADILLRQYEQLGKLFPIGYLDDDKKLWGMKFLDITVLGAIEKLPEIKHDGIVIAIGNNNTRKELARQFASSGEYFIPVIHPSAVIAPDVLLGNGIMICAGVVVNPGSVIGDHVILNTGSTIDHHNQINSYVHIAPGVHTGGEVVVEEGAFVGIGASVIPRVSIGAWSVIGAGAVVTKNIPPGVTAVGIPAKPLKK